MPGHDSMHGGPSYTATTTPPTLQAYENIFGPSARDIKDDLQKYKRHGRWHLPDILKGPNQYLTDRIDGLLTDATNSPFTSRILPYKYITNVDGKIKWNVWSFDEGLASRVPYESAARTLTQTKRGFAGYAVRQGMAIVLEHNFMMSEAGRVNFKNQLNQLIGSIQMTNDLDVHMALVLAPSYQRHMREKYILDVQTPAQKCRQFVDLFGFMQKNVNALDILIEEAKAMLRSWGSGMPDFLLTNSKLTFGLQMTPDRTNYVTQGPEGPKRLKAGPDIESYRGISIIPTRSFSMETGAPPRDILRRRVRVAEYYRIPPSTHNASSSFELYDEDRDTWFSMSFFQLLKHAAVGAADPFYRLGGLSMTDINARPRPPGFARRALAAGEAALPDSFDYEPQRLATDIEFGPVVYVPGYWNPSPCPIVLPDNVSPMVAHGVVNTQHHGTAEFLANGRMAVQPGYVAMASLVYRRYGIPSGDVRGNLAGLGRGGTVAMMTPAGLNRVQAPTYDNTLFWLRAANQYLCPNYIIGPAAQALNVVAAGGAGPSLPFLAWLQTGVATEELDRLLLARWDNRAVVADNFRDTFLARLVQDRVFSRDHLRAIAAYLQGGPIAIGGGTLVDAGAALVAVIGATLQGGAQPPAVTAELAEMVWPLAYSTAVGINVLFPNTGVGYRALQQDAACTLPALRRVLGDLPADWQAAYTVRGLGVLDDRAALGAATNLVQYLAFRYFHDFADHVNNARAFAYQANPNMSDWVYRDTRGGAAGVPIDDPTGLANINQDERALANMEVVIVRPNIEHYMIGVILGQGGEGLGSTFWGQTELSCYDDAQHGIWGMSYKYHERAIVINERNLVRLWDIAYDGYVGGKDDSAVAWGDDDADNPHSQASFVTSTHDVSKHYHGPSMMVMAFPHPIGHADYKPNWPSPIVYHDAQSWADQAASVYVDPENAERVDTRGFRVFDPAVYPTYDRYRTLMPNFELLAKERKNAGVATSENEVATASLAFQGSMRVRNAQGAIVTEIHGSGHHGNDFVGVASLRAGKGYRIQAQPTPGRLV